MTATEKINIEVMKLYGNFSLSDVDIFKKELINLLDQKKIYIILDLSELNYMSSIGLGTIINALREIQKLGGEFRLACLSETVNRIMDITKLDRVLKIHKTVEEAREAIQQELAEN